MRKNHPPPPPKTKKQKPGMKRSLGQLKKLAELAEGETGRNQFHGFPAKNEKRNAVPQAGRGRKRTVRGVKIGKKAGKGAMYLAIGPFAGGNCETTG